MSYSVINNPELIFLAIILIVVLFFSYSFFKTKITEKKYKAYVASNNGIIINAVVPSNFIPDRSIVYSWISNESKIDWVGTFKNHKDNIYIFLPVTFVYGQWSFISTCIVYSGDKFIDKNFTIVKNKIDSWSNFYRSLASRKSQLISFSELNPAILNDPHMDHLLKMVFSNYNNVSVDVYRGNIVIFFSGKIFNNILKIEEAAKIIGLLRKL